MIERIALKITDFIFKNTELDLELLEVYRYGVGITISTLLNFFWIITASVVVSDMLSGVIFLAVFILLMKFKTFTAAVLAMATMAVPATVASAETIS